MADGKTALITGSTSGIGLAIAERMAGAGMNLVLNGFGDAAEIEETRARISRETGVEAAYSPADMTRPAEIAAMVAEAIQRFGAIDVLVNNAGIQHVAPVDEFPVEKWDAIIAINMSSAFHTIRAALPGMREKGWGRVINIASVHGLVASPNKAAYITAKHGVVGLTRTVALECARSGVTVNAICPAYVLTPLVEQQIPGQAKTRGIPEDEVIDVLLAAQPTRRFVGTEEVSGLALFLCSEEARSITGAALSIDGGWSSQ